MLYATVRQRKIHVKNPVTVIQNGVNVDELLLDMDDEWLGMTSIVAVFTLKYAEKATVEEKEVTVAKEISKEMLYTFGEAVMVPWECLQYTGRLSVSVTGYVDSEKVMTTMLPDSFWNVVQNGAKTGDTPLEPTQTLYEQVLAAAGAANAAASAAIDVSNQLVQDKEEGKFDGKDGVPPTVKIGTVLTGASGSMASVENVGTDTAAVLNFSIPRGLPGKDGTTPIKGVDYFDGDAPVKGIDYFDGEPGKTPVKGVDYFDGEKGCTPKKGVDYFDGETPVKGVDYFDGKDAAQIVNMVVDGNYHLIITLDNGIVFDAGYVRGAAGAGAGDMLASEYDPQSAVRLAGGIPQYVAKNAPAPDLDGYAKTEDIPTKTSQLTNDSGYLTQHQSLAGYAKTEDIPTALSELSSDATHRTVTDAERNTWNGKSNFSGNYGDLSGIPSSFTPASHNHAASEVTSGTFAAARIPSLAASKIGAGTFAGQVVANSSGQAPGTSLLRNSKIVAEETTPTVNGEIFWVRG